MVSSKTNPLLEPNSYKYYTNYAPQSFEAVLWEETMAPYPQSFVRSVSVPSVDERRWVINIRDTLEELLEEDIGTPVSVYAVPKPLLACKPEAYNPQLFALGPYHHWQPQLYEMERYKLATAKQTQRQLRGLTLEQLVQTFAEHETRIRAHYHKYLDCTGETLAWLMAIDASFLLEFLRNYADAKGKVYRKVPSMSHMIDSGRIKLAYNLIVRDVVMLENQIPLFLVREILCFQSRSKQAADNDLSTMLIGFIEEVSPFKAVENFSSIDFTEHAHLLALLYRMIVPKTKEASETHEIEEHKDAPESDKAMKDDSSYVKQLFNSVWNYASGLNGAPITYIKRVFINRPIKFLVKIPWKIISRLPGISQLKEPIETLFCFQGDGKSKDEESSNKPPLVEEIMIPSVTELIKAGIKFAPTSGDLTTIEFNVKTITLRLPTVSLDVNTEVLLRNLIAYEASVELGPMVFTRYTELINGIIDTEEDVKLLRERGIILNRMKKDGEVADLWNGMSKSVRLSRVPFIDKVIEDVNKHYNSCWSVRTRKFMNKYVLGSWQFLTFLSAMLLLLMTCLQAFCSVYSCSAHWYGIVKPN